MQVPFTTSDGRDVTISLDEDDYEIRVFADSNGVELGGFDFKLVEELPPLEDHLHITWGYLDGDDGTWVHKGIGRKCLELATLHFGYPITAADHDGQQRDDGGHLTGDAPTFVMRMRSEGIIV